MDTNEKRQREMKERRKQRKKKKVQIQELYKQNVKQFDIGSDQYGCLLMAIEEYSAPAIWAILKNSSFSQKEDFEEVIQSGREEFLKKGKRTFDNYAKKSGDSEKWMFADYARQVYRHRAWDYIKKRKKEKDADPVPGDVYIESAFDNHILSAGEMLIDYYIKAIMNSDGDVFQIIFLCYSKILPVMLGETHCTSADSWAWEHMQDQTMFWLSDNFVKYFNSITRAVKVAFGQAYLRKLEEPYTDKKNNRKYEKLGEVVLTDIFEKGKTKNWGARLNKKILTEVVTEIMNGAEYDTELIQIIESMMNFAKANRR